MTVPRQIRPLLYITRREYRRERPSWWLRFPSDAGLLYHTFHDHLYGGKARALAAAKAVRAKLLSTVRQPYTPEGYRVGPHRHASGIHFDVQIKRDGLYTAWVASWMQDGRQKKKHFMIGDMRSSSKAKRLAKEWRERMVRHGGR